MWTEKHKPKTLDEFIGNKTAVDSIRKFDWKKPLLVHGAAGVGKSALVETLASEMNFDMVEVDDSNIDQIDAIAQTSGLYGNRKLVVIDNVDSVPDVKKVTAFLEKTRNPTVLITSDPKSKRLKTLKTLCAEIQMRRPQAASIAARLAEILKTEGVSADKELLLEVAERSNGDVRVALIDMEVLAKGRSSISKNDLEVLYARDVEGDIYKTLGLVFNGKKLDEVVGSTWDLDEEPRNVIFWIEENVPGVIQEPGPMAKAFHFLSRADVFLGRILRRQYWGFLRYANSLMTAGVNVSKEKPRYAMYRFPSFFMKMSSSRGGRSMTSSLGAKMKPRIHVSNNSIFRDYVPLFRTLLKHKKVDESSLKLEYALSDEELDYIKEN
jgi:replication factor C large subunit